MIAELRLWRTWPGLFRLLAVPVLAVWLHPLRALRQMRETEEALRLALKTLAVALDVPPDPPPGERHLHVIRN